MNSATPSRRGSEESERVALFMCVERQQFSTRDSKEILIPSDFIYLFFFFILNFEFFILYKTNMAQSQF